MKKEVFFNLILKQNVYNFKLIASGCFEILNKESENSNDTKCQDNGFKFDDDCKTSKNCFNFSSCFSK